MLNPRENREDRETLRRCMLQARNILDLGQRVQAGSRIAEQLREEEFFRQARRVMAYASYRSEVPTENVVQLCLQERKHLAFPLTDPRQHRLRVVSIKYPQSELIPGFNSIPEPRPDLLPYQEIDPETLDLVLVPGVAFDSYGGRLGYGGGYYDRFLQQQAPGALRVGLAYELQLVERVPVAEHDQVMDCIVTEKRCLECSRSRHAKNSRLS